jgi:Tfp pilus assembly protein FimT
VNQRTRDRSAGLTLLELLFAIAVGVTVTGIALPLTADAVHEIRAAAAARYVAGRIMAIRMEAVRRSTAVALRFEPIGADYTFAVFQDGNGNGVRTADIQAGIDRRLTSPERIGDKFPGVRFQLPQGVPDADGTISSSQDGVRIGTARILTMSPDGSCTAGTLYLSGRRGQYAVRALGATGRTRVLYFDPGEGAWVGR